MKHSYILRSMDRHNVINGKGIINKINDGIVILATGNLEKKLSVKATKFTKAAKEKIEALGGKAEVI